MNKHLQYAKYIFRHKWFVMLACFSKGLIWQGIIHDLSKFRLDEWLPYANFFYNSNGSKKTVRDSTGYYKPTDTGNKAFDFAWLLHQKRNKHHWQWWVLPEDNGGVKILEMPYKYVLEMYCDWIGAGRAQNIVDWNNPKRWYELNKSKMQLHENTKKLLESWMNK